MLLVGVTGVHIPGGVLLTSVLVFIVVPLAAGYSARAFFLKTKGLAWLEHKLLPAFRPVAITALLATLTLIFAFQAGNILGNKLMVALLAVPILIQVYFNSGLAYLLMRLFNVRHEVATPGALIGASNFFELAVAVAILARRLGHGRRRPCGSARHALRLPLLRRNQNLVSARPDPMNAPASKPRVLILCTGNSCRSHMAEGILRAAAGDILEVHSAGSRPTGFVHPKAIAVLAEIGIDISSHTSKSMNDFLDRDIDTVITVCGNADQACPVFPGQIHRHHWPFDDPAHATGTEEEILSEFRRVRDEIQTTFLAYAAEAKKITSPSPSA
jgi:arsenate reductase